MKTESEKIGTCFSFSHDAVVSEIPSVQDVLFVMGLSEEEVDYVWCKTNHELYVTNVHRAVVAASFEVTAKGLSDETEARRIIARAIIDLCPEKARCLFNPAFVEAQIMVGKDLGVVLNSSREVRLNACTCQACRQIVIDSSCTD